MWAATGLKAKAPGQLGRQGGSQAQHAGGDQNIANPATLLAAAGMPGAHKQLQCKQHADQAPGHATSQAIPQHDCAPRPAPSALAAKACSSSG